MVRISRHANVRLKERSGLPKKSRQRMADKAITEGIRRQDAKGRLRKWLDSIYYKSPSDSNIFVYGHMVYIVGADRKLVTILNVPSNLKHDMPKMVKKGKKHGEEKPYIRSKDN